jgi:hypothetical protein
MPALVDAGLVDGHDIRVLEAGRCDCFRAEPFESLGTRLGSQPQGLDRPRPGSSCSGGLGA